ncbi:MAG: S26 family signal peptidase [Myxococcota bacterium]
MQQPLPSSLVRYTVDGWSMWPSLVHGQTVLVAPRTECAALGYAWPPEAGAIVVAHHPFRRGQTIVKRVAVTFADGRFELRGDLPVESEDSGALGPFPLAALIGRVVLGVRPADSSAPQS